MKLILPLLLIGTLIAAQGCTDWRQSGTGDAEKMEIERYDLGLSAYPGADSTERADFRERYAAINDIMIRLYASSHPEVRPETTDSTILAYATSRGVGMFGCAIRERLGSLDSVEHALGAASRQAMTLIPEIKWPRLYGVISSYSQSIILCGDSVALIGTNHYLGTDDEAYLGFDSYIRQEKCLRVLPRHLTESLLNTQMPYAPSEGDETALSRMLYTGAVEWITARLTATDDFGAMLGWDDRDKRWAADNEASVWKSMINRKILYSTDPTMGERITQAAPATPLINPEAPGRIGTWIGMRIVDAYMKGHPDMKAVELLNKDFYGNALTLVESGYNPFGK
ncbi:hypothetical protein [uncultured Muribaculum sp.]|uniref:gliding motility protein GldB-related protein n=1 Tax=uncultured Muribaculum sp. TaxID=1918613 RepID=UPI0025F1D3E8|nr:hypothetical protein [uncultured Muribaculum sp.]